MFAFIAIGAIKGNLYAQSNKFVVLDNVKSLNKSAGYINRISTRAARDFALRYPDVERASWYAAKNGFIVHFRLDSCRTRTAYNLGGNWVYTIKVYAEDKMPRNVRHTVKSTYYDYTITQVEEIDRPNEKKLYLVHMCDASTWINVQVMDGEMKVAEEFRKK